MSVVAGGHIGFSVSVAEPTDAESSSRSTGPSQLIYDDGLVGVVAERIYQGD